MIRWQFLLSSMLMGTALLGASTGMGAELGRIELKESLGRDYAPQVLHYNMTMARGALRDAGHCALLDDTGTVVRAQFTVRGLWDDGSVRSLEVALLSGLSAGESRGFTLDDSGQAAADEGAFTVLTEGDVIVFSSPTMGVRIPSLAAAFPDGGRPAETVPPPVAQVRGKTRWYGKGALECDLAVVERGVKVTDDGPIYKRASVEYTFVGGQKYVVQVTLNRGEPLVRVAEQFTLPFTRPARAAFVFDLAAGLDPDYAVQPPMHGPGPSLYGVGSLWDLRPYHGDMFPISYERDATWTVLAPWCGQPGEGLHVAFYNSAVGGDMIGVVNTAPEKWTHIAYDILPGDSWKLVQNPHMFFTLRQVKNVPVVVGADRSLKARFPLTTGGREWAFFVSDAYMRTEDVVTGKGDKAKTTTYASGPRTTFDNLSRRYSRNALDRVKDYVLDWPAEARVAYPHLYADAGDYASLRQAYNAWYGEERIASLSDPVVVEKMKRILLSTVDELLDRLFTNPGPPHHIAGSVYLAANLADHLLGGTALSDREKARVRAAIAYAGYALAWRGYWHPEAGGSANPNMSSFCYNAVGLVGLLLRDHPASASWVERCTTQTDREMDNWITSGGAWIENAHYILASWGNHTMVMRALKHNGVRDYCRLPSVRRFLEYFFDLQTPPDPAVGGQRVTVQIGNAYPFRTVSEFGIWAREMKDVDPVFASQLMWMWQEQGYGNAVQMKGKKFWRGGAGLSHWFGAVQGLPPFHEMLFYDPSIRPVAPTARRDADYPDFGCVLQSHFGTDKETKVFFRSGQTYSHYDVDQGSFLFYGKGAPLVLDHGYGEFHPWLHNRISVNHMWDESLGRITSFLAGDGSALAVSEVTLDTLSAREYAGVRSWPMQPEPIKGRATATPWTRRIVFQKDADPAGPNYLVMRDVVRGELPTEWTLWVHGEVADLGATPLRAKGPFGTDLLVYLLDADKGVVSTADVEFKNKVANRDSQVIHLRRPAGRGVLAVLYPVLPGEAVPVVTALARTLGVKLAAGDRTDWTFVPEGRAALTVDGLEFEGTTAGFSRRTGVTYFTLGKQTRLSGGGLTVEASLPVELALHADRIEGCAGGGQGVPRVRLTGAVGARVTALKIDGRKQTLAPSEDGVWLPLPMGDTRFEVTLK